MLLSISEALETPVSVLLGEAVTETKADDVKAISEKLEIINLQLARNKAAKRKTLCGILMSLCIVIMIIFAILLKLDSPYLGWDYSDPETAVVGVAMHAFEWIFIRVAPIILIGAIAGIILVSKRK